MQVSVPVSEVEFQASLYGTPVNTVGSRHQNIDEVDVNRSDYIYSTFSNATTTRYFIVNMGPLEDPGVNTGMVITMDCGKDGSGGVRCYVSGILSVNGTEIITEASNKVNVNFPANGSGQQASSVYTMTSDDVEAFRAAGGFNSGAEVRFQAKLSMVYTFLGTNRNPRVYQIKITAPDPPPVVAVTSQTKTKISRVAGTNQSAITWTSSQPFTEYQIRIVPSPTSPVSAGTLLEQNQDPPSGGSASTTYTSYVTDSEMVAAGAAEGNNMLKVFCKNADGTWSS